MKSLKAQARELLGSGDEVADEHVRLAVGYLTTERDAEAQVRAEGSRFDKRGRLTPAARASQHARDALVKLKAGIDQMAHPIDATSAAVAALGARHAKSSRLR